jgi:2,4-dichlorophenol 6-monooxygenase
VKIIKTPVLIVGGGGAGLTASMLLSTLGIESHLVSSLPTTSVLPKAHILNQRAMEIMSDVGTADEIYQRSTPPEAFSHTGIYVGFAGHELAGRQIAKLECWGTGGRNETWVAASPLLSTNLPQIRLEPILKKRADELSPNGVHFNHEVVSIRQTEEKVIALVRDKGADEEYEVHASYVLACDGGRTVGRQLGIELVGLRKAASQVSFHISADFSPFNSDDDVLIRWIGMPHLNHQVVMVPMGPTKWGSQSEEWVVHLNYPYDDPRSLDDEKVEADLRFALGIGDYPLVIHTISRWASEGIVADKFSVGRVFVCGDAAHRHPPTGGLGLTSAMHDVQNICWKLALVVKGFAKPELLMTYEAERRPVVERNVRRSLENAAQWGKTWRALGLMDQNSSIDEKWSQLKRLWSDDPSDDEFRSVARNLFAQHSMEFQEQNVEYGYSYSSDAVVEDGTEPIPNPDDIRLYLMETRPGHPLPHAWVERKIGEKVSTIDLVKPGRFLLIAGEDGDAWKQAASLISQELGVAIDAVSIGHTHGDFLDPRLAWLKNRGISNEGAILVRPDRFVAWRSFGSSSTPQVELRRALKKVLHLA